MRYGGILVQSDEALRGELIPIIRLRTGPSAPTETLITIETRSVLRLRKRVFGVALAGSFHGSPVSSLGPDVTAIRERYSFVATFEASPGRRCSGSRIWHRHLSSKSADLIERGSDMTVLKIEGCDHLVQAFSRPGELRVGEKDVDQGIGKHTPYPQLCRAGSGPRLPRRRVLHTVVGEANRVPI